MARPRIAVLIGEVQGGATDSEDARPVASQAEKQGRRRVLSSFHFGSTNRCLSAEMEHWFVSCSLGDALYRHPTAKHLSLQCRCFAFDPCRRRPRPGHLERDISGRQPFSSMGL